MARSYIEAGEADQEQNRHLKIALEESLKLQTHYAELLNMYDGGLRIGFKTIDEWVDRLKVTGKIK
jgi:hypothetical protein